MNLTKIWTYKCSESILCLESGDINDNGQVEVIVGTSSGKILILSCEGKLLFERTICDDLAIFHLKLDDLDNDGIVELIAGGMDGLLRVFKLTKSFDLEPDWAHQFGASISGICLEYLDFGAINGIVCYSLDKTLRVLNPEDGTLLWGQVFEEGIAEAIILKNPTEKNTNNVIACGNDGTMRCFSGKNGDLLWFKRYTDKLRCLSLQATKNCVLIACGGDDQKLHFIRERDREEVGVIEFEEIVWKCRPLCESKVIASSYSFAYLDDKISVEDIEFNSKICCIDDNLDVLWELNGVNVEDFEIFKILDTAYILIGTTTGKVLILDISYGWIIGEIDKKSCVNAIKFVSGLNFIISCHDNGEINSFSLDE
ncbi:MAG: PQQ-binding-like beta-propeller repeat protein [Promethearchaeota archaeon]